jgi:hypothetical protein
MLLPPWQPTQHCNAEVCGGEVKLHRIKKRNITATTQMLRGRGNDQNDNDQNERDLNVKDPQNSNGKMASTRSKLGVG